MLQLSYWSLKFGTATPYKALAIYPNYTYNDARVDLIKYCSCFPSKKVNIADR